MNSQSKNSSLKLFLPVIGIVILIGFLIKFFLDTNPKSTTEQQELAKLQPAKPIAEPIAQYPVPAVVPSETQQSAPAAPFQLPSLDQSDESISEALLKITDKTLLEQVFTSKDFIRSAVITIDNLTKPSLPIHSVPVKLPTGELQVDPKTMTIRSANESRYKVYVDFLKKLDLKKMTRLYIQYYPLFQKVYLETNSSGHFNDRVVEVISHLQETPEVNRPVQLIRGKVVYTFANAQLEELSAGQKIMIRIGPQNSKTVNEFLQTLKMRLIHLNTQFD